MALSGGRVFGALVFCLFVCLFPHFLSTCAKEDCFLSSRLLDFCSVGGEGFPIGSSEARGVRRGSVRCDLCLFVGSVFGYWLECWRFVESSSLCLFFFGLFFFDLDGY